MVVEIFQRLKVLYADTRMLCLIGQSERLDRVVLPRTKQTACSLISAEELGVGCNQVVEEKERGRCVCVRLLE